MSVICISLLYIQDVTRYTFLFFLASKGFLKCCFFLILSLKLLWKVCQKPGNSKIDFAKAFLAPLRIYVWMRSPRALYFHNGIYNAGA
jgi:hypothetical protein